MGFGYFSDFSASALQFSELGFSCLFPIFEPALRVVQIDAVKQFGFVVCTGSRGGAGWCFSAFDESKGETSGGISFWAPWAQGIQHHPTIEKKNMLAAQNSCYAPRHPIINPILVLPQKKQ